MEEPPASGVSSLWTTVGDERLRRVRVLYIVDDIADNVDDVNEDANEDDSDVEVAAGCCVLW